MNLRDRYSGMVNPPNRRSRGPITKQMTSQELLELLRGFKGVNLVGADVVEVSPPFDHAAVTAVAASHCAFDLVGLMAAAGTR